eukprot:52037-Eustigmatos_ZCMA.PRE.1
MAEIILDCRHASMAPMVCVPFLTRNTDACPFKRVLRALGMHAGISDHMKGHPGNATVPYRFGWHHDCRCVQWVSPCWRTKAR